MKMQRRPKTLEAFAIFFVAVAVSFPIQIVMLYEHNFFEAQEILLKLTVINWVVIGLAIGNAIILLRASSILKYSLPILALTVVVNNFFVGYAGDDYSIAATTLSSIAFLMTHLALCQPHIIMLLKQPEKRWWLTPPRKEMQVVTFVNALNGPTVRVKTFDLSEGGAFFPIEKSTPLRVGDRLMLSFSLGSISRFRCEGRVVRSSEGGGKYPAGVGVSFDYMAWPDRQTLRRYIQSHV
jgi:hypothetical protein